MNKRLSDILISIVAIIILAVPFLIIALIVKLSSKGPVIYWSRRFGQNENFFMMPKFRTMKINTPEISTDKLTIPENYLTPTGPFLRRTSLDEIPQFFSVLIGDMSVVGPRPVLHKENEVITRRNKLGINKLKPGITGWAQVNGRDNVTLDEKVKFDHEYLLKQNLTKMTQLLTVLPYIWKDWEFQQGLILGLSEIENPLSPCYVTLQTLEDTLLSAQYQVDFNQYARGVISKGNTPTDSGYITSIFEFLVDLSLIGFNFYKDCMNQHQLRKVSVAEPYILPFKIRVGSRWKKI